MRGEYQEPSQLALVQLLLHQKLVPCVSADFHHDIGSILSVSRALSEIDAFLETPEGLTVVGGATQKELKSLYRMSHEFCAKSALLFGCINHKQDIKSKLFGSSLPLWSAIKLDRGALLKTSTSVRIAQAFQPKVILPRHLSTPWSLVPVE